ncbi:class I SAM-dependent methyltransferase [Sabulicella rubraurantiaca]|uniref:class I SAM-dependent methyltransferase n=1 Tax=Sabulicella rubraurantiaca TaxID=2811429 RepID=UPI001A97AD2A|nr:class I SAM-dependent methyltransferase [Sabulicella rubraurantiaca]
MSGTEPPALWPLMERVGARYAAAPAWSRGFVRGKLLTDPVTPALLRLAAASGGLGSLVDLGCGRGQTGIALLLAGLAGEVTGLDLDPAKIRDATEAAQGLPARFAVADLSVADVPEADTAMMLDVLLQMEAAAQLPLLRRIAAAARRRVLIRAFDPAAGWRAALGSAMEEAGRRIRRDGSHFRPMALEALAAPFREAGFRVQVAPCWGWTPLPNVLLVAERGDS